MPHVIYPQIKTSRLLSISLLMLSVATLTGCELESEVPRATCGANDMPETGMQGQVPLADRKSGRSQQGYTCNMKRVSHYQGTGSATNGAKYGNCMYSGSFGLGAITNKKPGVQVVDFSDLNNPKLTAILDSTAMKMGTWETLRVHHGRGLLAAAGVPLNFGGGFMSVYDVKDCANPKLLNGLTGKYDNKGDTPFEGFTAHEASFSPDGNTYWTSGNVPGALTAFDITDPSKPRIIFQGLTGLTNHGFDFSPDGKTMYMSTLFPAGISIFDVSSIQERKSFPMLRMLGRVSWTDGLTTQQALPFTYKGRKLVFGVDEFGSGGVRLIDVENPSKAQVVRKYELEINRKENASIRLKETAKNGIFGYEAHYCNIDRYTNPKWLACNYVQSGLRVFDISDLLKPKEVAYYNPPTTPAKRKQLLNSAHATAPISSTFSDIINGNVSISLDSGADMTTDWCMSKPEFVGNKIWVHCDDAGAQVLEFTNGVGPRV